MTMQRDPLTLAMPVQMQVRNATGSALPAGSLVYVNGYHTSSGLVTVAAADADGAPGANIAELILPFTIANGANGIAVQHGLLDGVDTSGGAVGDPVYLSTTAGTPTLTLPGNTASVQVVGRVVTAANPGRILFRLQSPTSIQRGAASMLGELNFPLSIARKITAADFGVIAVGGAGTVGSGGILGVDGATAVALKRRNVGTDPTADILYAANVVDEVGWDFGVPADMDVTKASIFTVLASMGGASNTPVIAVKCHTGVGGANLGGNTAALAATEAALPVTIAANSFTNGQQAIVTLVPAAHAADTVRIRRLYLTYTKK